MASEVRVLVAVRAEYARRGAVGPERRRARRAELLADAGDAHGGTAREQREAGLASSRHDRFILVLALLVPAVALLLGRWTASLDTSFVPRTTNLSRVFDETFARDVAGWLPTHAREETALYVLVERGCACTRATLTRLEKTLHAPGAEQVRVHVDYVDDGSVERDERWQAVLRGVPATPAVLAVKDGRLVYAGPVLSGSLCTTSGQIVPALLALANTGARRPFFNLVTTGCYCARKADIPSRDSRVDRSL